MPRIAALIFAADIISVDFSVFTYLVMAVFSFSLSVAALKKDILKEG